MANFEIKEDCILFCNKELYFKKGRQEGYCKGLNELYCKKEHCRFYKSNQKYRIDGSKLN